ncbi:signal recognition particle-docking protein FtsY [Candidatus Pacearchaeota archaeon]|nr:signal recognition particle-docking protein FtsY [Candidatus Pacearchaeota archaeon]
MFDTLKNKLKKWASKNGKDKDEIVEEVPKKETKKKSIPKKKLTKKPKKEIAQEPTTDNRQPTTKKKRSFFSKTLTEEKFDELFEELQIILLQNNVAYETVEAIKESLKESLTGKSLKEVNLSKELKSSIQSLLINPPNFIEEIKKSKSKPFVILFSGINGSGKTTTIAKLAYLLQQNSITVCLAASDTFRAAAIQQLEIHGQNLKIPVIKKDYGADPASVGFDALKYASKHKIDVVLIDTAGRMQNRDSLMKELEKISRVTKPDMKIFLGESITGNDAIQQAKAFDDAIDLNGIILSKTDVDEKGGTALSVAHITGKPILFIGTGQEYKDLEVFDKKKLIKKLGL